MLLDIAFAIKFVLSSYSVLPVSKKGLLVVYLKYSVRARSIRFVYSVQGLPTDYGSGSAPNITGLGQEP